METSVCLHTKINNISNLLHKQESNFPAVSLCFLKHYKKCNFESDSRGRQTKQQSYILLKSTTKFLHKLKVKFCHVYISRYKQQQKMEKTEVNSFQVTRMGAVPAAPVRAVAITPATPFLKFNPTLQLPIPQRRKILGIY